MTVYVVLMSIGEHTTAIDGVYSDLEKAKASVETKHDKPIHWIVHNFRGLCCTALFSNGVLHSIHEQEVL